MKTNFLKALPAALLFGLLLGPVLAQPENKENEDIKLTLDAPGAAAGLGEGAPAPPSGPLQPAITLDTSPAAPTATEPMPADGKPFPVGPVITKALAEKTPEERERFARHLSTATRLMQSNQVQSSLEHILEAEAIYDKFPALHNLKGAAFSKVRDFEKAKQAFRKCLELEPGSLEAQFNLAEMDFVEKNYDAAVKAFNALLVDNPTMAAPTRSLLRYKSFLCLLLLDRTEESEAILKTFRFDSDTPEYYFANAAKAFQIDDKDDAREWLGSAARIYGEALQTIYLDSMIEIGWIESI